MFPGKESDDRQPACLRTMAAKLVDDMGVDAALRMCQANLWYGIIAEIEAMGGRDRLAA